MSGFGRDVSEERFALLDLRERTAKIPKASGVRCIGFALDMADSGLGLGSGRGRIGLAAGREPYRLLNPGDGYISDNSRGVVVAAVNGCGSGVETKCQDCGYAQNYGAHLVPCHLPSSIPMKPKFFVWNIGAM